MNRPKIAIIGGMGYIGSSLGKHLASKFDIKVLDLKKPQKPIGYPCSFETCDVRKYETVRQSLEDVDLVIHTSIVQIPIINEQKKLGFEVNILGTQNVCKAVSENTRTRGLILSGSWHSIGEKHLQGVVDEEFGFKPDNVEERARLYALSKISQETIVRYYDEMSNKTFGIIRMGTVLGEGMPEKTAANIFIENALKGQPITPFSSSMFRPMLYVDVEDVSRAYENFANKILSEPKSENTNSLAHIFNVYYPEVVTILDIAIMVRNATTKLSNEEISPEIQIVKSAQPSPFTDSEKTLIKPNINKALHALNLGRLKSPQESIERLIASKMVALNFQDGEFNLALES